jgi:hypothetical protein
MEWFLYLIGSIALGAVVLAIYEKRKGLKMRYDAPPHDAQVSERGAYTQAERIRTEGVFLPGNNNGPD